MSCLPERLGPHHARRRSLSCDEVLKPYDFSRIKDKMYRKRVKDKSEYFTKIRLAAREIGPAAMMGEGHDADIVQRPLRAAAHDLHRRLR